MIFFLILFFFFTSFQAIADRGQERLEHSIQRQVRNTNECNKAVEDLRDLNAEFDIPTVPYNFPMHENGKHSYMVFGGSRAKKKKLPPFGELPKGVSKKTPKRQLEPGIFVYGKFNDRWTSYFYPIPSSEWKEVSYKRGKATFTRQAPVPAQRTFSISLNGKPFYFKYDYEKERTEALTPKDSKSSAIALMNGREFAVDSRNFEASTYGSWENSAYFHILNTINLPQAAKQTNENKFEYAYPPEDIQKVHQLFDKCFDQVSSTPSSQLCNLYDRLFYRVESLKLNGVTLKQKLAKYEKRCFGNREAYMKKIGDDVKEMTDRWKREREEEARRLRLREKYGDENARGEIWKRWEKKKKGHD